MLKYITPLLFLLPNVAWCQNWVQEINTLAHLEQTQINSSTSLQSVASDNFNVHYYRCEWDIDPAQRYIKGSITSYFMMSNADNQITFDLQSNLTVDSVRYHQQNISFIKTTNDGLKILLPTTVAQNSNDSIQIYYQGVPLSPGSGSFTVTNHNGTPVLWTLSEPYGAKEWWPCKNGLTDKADSIDIIITHPSSYTASSIGRRMGTHVIGGNTRTSFKHRYPIASYLVALAVTNYTIWQDTVMIGQTTLPLESYFYPESKDYFVYAENNYTKKALRDFTSLVGPYPFIKEKYGHTQFSVNGGMEHQTNSFVGNGADYLLAHELAHQWFGDQITCRSWSDIWLNEGFATYLQVVYNEVNNGKTAFLKNLRDVINNVTSIPDGSVYVNDTTSEARVFSGRLSYNKGLYVLHMLRGVLGDSTFFRGLRRYLQDPTLQYGFSTTDDFIRNMEKESGQNLHTFFQNWIYGEGYPNYQATWTQNKNGWVKLVLNQTTTHASVPFYAMPVPIMLKSGSSTTSLKLDHQYSGQVFWVKSDVTVDSVFIDPEYWILAKERLVTKSSYQDEGSNAMTVFPNPTNNKTYLTIKDPTEKQLQIRLFNTVGQTLIELTVTTEGKNETIQLPTDKLSKGVYWIKTWNGKENRTFQLVRE